MLNESIDKLNKIVYNIIVNSFLLEGLELNISEQIKVLCVRANISNAELARRLNVSPQSLSAKLKRESFTIQNLEQIAEVTGSEFRHNFILPNGEIV